MGWLFNRKKKVPKVPFPEPQSFSSDTLRFPEKIKERVIEPEDIRLAAGLRDDVAPRVPEEISGSEDSEDSEMESEEIVPSLRIPAPITSGEPLYVKMDVYQRILGEISRSKEDLLQLGGLNQTLENSEYNEEANFEKLRKTMKTIHDRLLEADRVLFKS